MGKKKNKKKSKKKAAVIPKSLRKGALPSSVSDVIAAGFGALRDAQKSGGDQFDALVRRGRAIQTSGSDAAREAAQQVEGAVDRVLESVRSRGESVVEGVQDRAESVVESVMARLGVPTRDEIQALQATVDALEARVVAAGANTPSVARETFEVRTHPDGWGVHRAGGEVAVSKTKKEAMVEARAQARRHAPSVLTVYKLDGTLSDTTEYDG